jgi:hypothetical protein
MTPRLSCLIVLLTAAFACSAQVPRPDAAGMGADEAAQLQAAQEASAAYYLRIAAELAATGQPRELAFAATLAGPSPAEGTVPGGDAPSQASPGDPRVAQWRQLASARAGSDVLANILLLQGDSRTADATRGQALERWQRLEPDNLAPRLYAGAAEDWLPQAGAYARLDMHYYEQLRWIQAALAAHPPRANERAMFGGADVAPEEAAAIAAAGIMAAVALPGLRTLAEACRDALDAAPTRRADCGHVGRVAADTADTSLGTSIGISLLQATAATPVQRADAQALQRRQDWQMIQWNRAAASQPDDGAAQFVRLLRDPTVRSERDLVERVLAEAGIPHEPPAGWEMPRR